MPRAVGGRAAVERPCHLCRNARAGRRRAAGGQRAARDVGVCAGPRRRAGPPARGRCRAWLHPRLGSAGITPGQGCDPGPNRRSPDSPPPASSASTTRAQSRASKTALRSSTPSSRRSHRWTSADYAACWAAALWQRAFDARTRSFDGDPEADPDLTRSRVRLRLAGLNPDLAGEAVPEVTPVLLTRLAWTQPPRPPGSRPLYRPSKIEYKTLGTCRASCVH